MSEAARVALISLVWVAFLGGLFALVRHARARGRMMRSAAMFAALFGWGNMRDPRNDTVAEARDGRIRSDAESGEPPDWR